MGESTKLAVVHSPSNLKAVANVGIGATLVGFMEVETGNRIRTPRLVTDKATHQGAGPRRIALGLAARSVP